MAIVLRAAFAEGIILRVLSFSLYVFLFRVFILCYPGAAGARELAQGARRHNTWRWLRVRFSVFRTHSDGLSSFTCSRLAKNLIWECG